MNSRNLLILLLIILFTVLQCTALNYIRILGAKPDLLLILIVFSSFNLNPLYGLGVGALCGLFSEATSGIPSGLAVLAYSAGGLILGYIGRWVYNPTLFGEMCLTFVSALGVYLFFFFLLQTINMTLPFLNAFVSIILPASFYTACVAPALFRFLRIILPVR